MKLNILIYSQLFAPSVGGVETHVMLLARGLVTCQIHKPVSVTVVTNTARGAFDDISLAFRIVRRPPIQEFVNLFWSADIIHVSGPALFPMFLGLLLGKRVIVEHHGFQTACPNGQLFFEPSSTPCPGHFMTGRHTECLRCNVKFGRLASLKMWLLTFPRRFLCRMVSANIVPTVWLSEILRLPRTKWIPHGLPLPPPSSCNREPGKFPSFVFLGRLVSTKGTGILIAAAEKLKQQGYVFRVRIIGDGPDLEILQNAAEQSQLQGWVEFLGHVPDGELEDALADAVAIVMPSLGGEVFGLVAAENMLRERLVIASDIGALREVLGDAGLFFPPGDEAALMDCMRQVLLDVPRTAALRQKAFERASSNFDVNVMVQKHLSLYGELG